MAEPPFRSLLYRRLHWLWPILARPGVRRAGTLLGWTLVAAYFAFAALILVLRHAVLPAIGQYQPQIEQALGQLIGLPVTIGRIEAGWDGLDPHLTLSHVLVSDRQGRTAFALNRVDGVLSWQTLWRLQPTLGLLAVEGPVLHVRRDKAGRITVAGVEAEGESDPRLAEWVFAQARIRVRDAIIVWEDGLRAAPPLILEDLQFGLDNRGDRHRFGLSAAPPAELAARLDVRGEFRGSLGEALDRLAGRLFVELDYADLAGWRAWVDYPVHLPQGRGAVRLWGDWNEGQGKVTADVALEDVRIRLGPSLPELDLASMRGRLEGQYRQDGWELAGSRIELQSLDGIRVAPSDFRLGWRQDPKNAVGSGNASASRLDLQALTRLADYLPLDAGSRRLLASHRPEGSVADLRASWESEGESLRRYTLRARFDGLGLRAAGRIPGAGGFSGELDIHERGGALVVDSRAASLDLPAVFPQPHLALGSLRAKASWYVEGKVVNARLERLEFAGDDAAGSARGTWRYAGDGPGHIDLVASLDRADGRAVWRYLPFAVDAHARDWLRRGIVAGTASDARLVLKGDLRDFPFRDKSKGEFGVTARAQGVTIDYAPGWPAIEDIDGEMSFGVGMRVRAHKGAILGTRIGPVAADIPDFEDREQMLLVSGQVEGPTAEFLRFIDQSPVGDKIERFTEDMRAAGNGRLDLKLDLPLGHVKDTRVQGDYLFQNNEVAVLPGLPPLTQVNGRLKFTEASVTAREINAQVLGGPMKLAIRNEGERVNVSLAGSAAVREARKFYDLPLFDYLAGTTSWKGEVRVRRKSADFVVESSLAGISSSLPEPFNKTAASTLPLRFEKRNLTETARDGKARDQIHVSLDPVGEALLQRRQEGGEMHFERGAAAVGAALPALPEHGLMAAVQVAHLDADFWKGVFGDGAGGMGGGLLSRLSLKTPAMRLLGRNYADVELNLRPREGGWQIGLSTREAAGDIFWREAAGGWLQADLRRLALPQQTEVAPDTREMLDSLPGMDIRVADFSVGDKHLGRLELKAHNDGGNWHLDSVGLHNPDARLKGRGLWSNAAGGEAQRTRLDFELVTDDAGRLLDRLGYPGSLRRGTATLKGDLAWNGAPISPHYPSLNGEMSLFAEKGQFAKVEPGIGKLLGLLSLQALPRRLTLDFRDIFSEGFAFDRIDAHLTVHRGIMRTTEDLRIDGPAARILMKGEADLRQETQDVLVTVQPEVTSVFSMGALILAHPAVGAATAIVNKLLQNPIDRIFSFQYRVHGAWDDPRIEKVGQSVKDRPADNAHPGEKHP